MEKLIAWTKPDERYSENVWNPIAIAGSVAEFAKLRDQETGYVWVDRDRELEANRRETAGILAGGEFALVPHDKIALFFLRTSPSRDKDAAWWPQIRFPDGAYAFAFSI